MKRICLSLALFLALFSIPCFAAFGSRTNLDVQTTGSSTNGGGFDPGVVSPGTDESMGAGTAITVTLTGTTTGTGSPVFSSTTHGPGNFVNIASGSGCTTGRYDILSQSGGIATFDHAMGSNGNTCTGIIGGSVTLATIVSSVLVAGNTIWIQAGSYSKGAFTDVTGITGYLYFIGYTSTHGDANSPVATITNTANVTSFFTGAGNVLFKNLAINGEGVGQTNSAFSSSGGNGITLINDSFANFNSASLVALNATPVTIINCYVGANVAQVLNSGVPVFIADSYITGNNTNTVQNTGLTIIVNTIFTATTGTADPIFGRSLILINDTIYGSAKDGIGVDSTSSNYVVIENTIVYGSAGFGIAVATGPTANQLQLYNNRLGNNTLGNYSGVSAGTGDASLSADPFVNKSGGNFALNATVGGGAACKGAGFPGAFPNGTTTGYPDIGAAQSQCSSSTFACGFSHLTFPYRP